ncbi:hypothetical protein GCM10023186_17620 [Hymenobacter koreensis]|uniref:Uncharacterized protein n=1 Tax=Hymenobacter koreensis TaxID=1084523 RepID=A0ABP8IYM1_9BACT
MPMPKARFAAGAAPGTHMGAGHCARAALGKSCSNSTANRANHRIKPRPVAFKAIAGPRVRKEKWDTPIMRKQ